MAWLLRLHRIGASRRQTTLRQLHTRGLHRQSTLFDDANWIWFLVFRRFGNWNLDWSNHFKRSALFCRIDFLILLHNGNKKTGWIQNLKFSKFAVSILLQSDFHFQLWNKFCEFLFCQLVWFTQFTNWKKCFQIKQKAKNEWSDSNQAGL